MNTEAVERLHNMLGISLHAMAKLGYITYHRSTKKYVLAKKGKKKLEQITKQRAIRAVSRKYGIYPLVAKDMLKRRR